MGIFDGILICTDLDGTLFKNDKTVSRENIEAIEFFKREGGRFTFVTGRMPQYSSDAYEKISPNAPFGCINGGGLYDSLEKKYIWTQSLPYDVVELVRCVDETLSDVGIQVAAFDKTYFSKDNDAMVSFRALTKVPNLVCAYTDVKEPIAKIIFASSKEDEILAVERLLRAHPRAPEFDFIRSERTLFEILPRGINKGTAIQKLVEHLGLDSNKTIAIGDYNNDIAMFGTAKIGIAVANACPEALERADMVTVSNEEHAIAKVIYDLRDGKIKL
ncbi:MAG: HAD family phosphatase [Clostridia bacterium]|nr:HAD family phosphatase [Clostridia bacterium]